MYPSIAKLGTIAGVWAHPDDESWCAGGIIAAAVANGQRVVSVVATKGGAGSYDAKHWPGPLEITRQKELETALEALGAKEHHWLDYQDGHCREADDEEAAAKVASILRDVKPDTVLTFGPDGLTGHPDHQAVGRWAADALELAKLPETRLLRKIESRQWYERIGRKLDEKYNYYFMTDHPLMLDEKLIDLSFPLPPELVERKLAALKAHASQTEKMFAELSANDLQALASFEGFKAA